MQTVAFASVFSVFPVFLVWHFVFPFLSRCHRDSLTRLRLALAQDAARDASSPSLFVLLNCDLPREFWQFMSLWGISLLRDLDVWCSCLSFWWAHLFFFTFCHLLAASNVSFSLWGRSWDRVTLECAQTWLRLGAQVVTNVVRTFGTMLQTTTFPYEIVGNDSAYFLHKVTLFSDVLTYTLIPRSGFLFCWNVCVFPCGRVLLMSGWSCQWKPLWIPVGNNFQKAYVEEWLHVGDDSTGGPEENSIKALLAANVSTMVRSSKNKDCTVKHEQPLDAPSAPRPMG